MKLYESDGKKLLQDIGIAIPKGQVVETAQAAAEAAQKLGYPVVVKAQLLSGGRGKAGAVRVVSDASALSAAFAVLKGQVLGDETIHRFLVEEHIDIAHELYAGITVDPISAKPRLMFSTQGGVDIERVAVDTPERLISTLLDPLDRPELDHMLAIVMDSGLTGRLITPIAAALLRLVEAYFSYESLTAEINPLVIATDQRVIAADAKFDIDDAALFRLNLPIRLQPETQRRNDLEAEAEAAGVSYVRLDEAGNIGLIAGGAGVGMATMDTVYSQGGVPANFLDLGGNATPEKTAAALRIVLKTPGVQGVFINVFGGINNCGQMAEGIVRVIEEVAPVQTIAVKMRGHSQDKGWALLEAKNIPVVKFGTTADGIALLIEHMQR